MRDSHHNKRYLLLLTFIFSISVNAQGIFTLHGNIKNTEGWKVKIIYGNELRQQEDSTYIKNGTFTIKDSLNGHYSKLFLWLQKSDSNKVSDKISAYVDIGMTTTIKADLNRLEDAKATGSKTQNEYNDFLKMTNFCTSKIKELNVQYESAKTETERTFIKSQIGSYTTFKNAAELCFIQTHPDSYISADLMRYKIGNMSFQDIKTIYDGFSPNVRQYAQGSQEIEREIMTLSSLQRGAPATDFTTTDIHGTPFTLSSLKGKVVILDFWASWCLPCRKSNPQMLTLYHQYHRKGLELVYVADDDNNPEAWKKAVIKDGLTGEGIHHVLRGIKWDRSKGLAGVDHSHDILNKYAIHFLPEKYIIDRDGNIICKINEGEDEKLKLWISYLLNGESSDSND